MRIDLALLFGAALAGSGCAEPARCPPPEECPDCLAASAAAAAPSAAPALDGVSALPLDLPRASSAETTVLFLAIEIQADGRLVTNGRALADTSELGELTRAELAKDAGLRVVVRGDRATTYGRLMEVVDAVKRAGATKIAFGVPASPAPP